MQVSWILSKRLHLFLAVSSYKVTGARTANERTPLSQLHFKHVSCKWSSLRFPHQNSVCNFPFPRTCYMACPYQSSWFDRPNYVEGYRAWSSSSVIKNPAHSKQISMVWRQSDWSVCVCVHVGGGSRVWKRTREQFVTEDLLFLFIGTNSGAECFSHSVRQRTETKLKHLETGLASSEVGWRECCGY
jgi:hypothetical protein